jgi:hypothetical protein
MTPWHCADCRLVVVPDEQGELREACTRCGCLTFRRGDSLLTLVGPMTRQVKEGLSSSDRIFLRTYRCAW